MAEVSCLEVPEETKICTAVLLPGPLVVRGVVGPVAERHEPLRMVEDEIDHRVAVDRRGPGILHNLGDIVLVLCDGVGPGHPLFEVPFGHGPALGVDPGGELDPPLGREGGSPLSPGGKEAVLTGHRGHPCSRPHGPSRRDRNGIS